MRYGKALLAFALIIVVLGGCEGPDPKAELKKLKDQTGMLRTEFQVGMDRMKRKVVSLTKQNEDLKRRGPTVAERKVFDGIPGLVERDGELVVLMTADILSETGGVNVAE